MYANHFGLTQDPFSIAPDPRYLFMSERHREALAHLLYGVGGTGRLAGGGFVLLTGDIGTGKTTICRCFLEQIPAGCHVAYIFNPKLTVTELLQSVCEEFHIAVHHGATATVKDYIDALNTFLLQSHAAGHSNVLIIDEAQNLAPDVLEQLRLLTNLETHERKLLQIVLIGQPELRAMLERADLEQLAQRIIARFHLDALNAAETTQYIQHRLAVAGHHGPLPFDTAALKRIHQLARGVPRRINLLCGRALLGAWATGLHRVTQAVVSKAATEVFGADRPAPARGWLRRSRAVLAAAVVVAGALAISTDTWQTWLPQWKPPTSKTVPATASPPQPPASVPQTPPKPAPRPVADATSLLQRLPHDMQPAWQALAALWKLPAVEGDVCEAANRYQLACFRATDLTIPQLRQLRRPGILSLQTQAGAPVYALLVGMTEQTATLQIGAQQHFVRLTSLAALWRGEFATLWRPPAGYTPGLREGQSGPAIDALGRLLAQWEGRPAPAPGALAPQTLDEPLKARVRAFQRSQGLKADGQPGPLTFMQMESASGTIAPQLLTDLP